MKIIKILFIIIFLIIIISFTNPQKRIEKSATSVRFYFNTGVSYTFPITTDYISQIDIGTINIPLSFGFDIRFKDWLSLYTGTDFIYGIHFTKRTIDGINYEYYFHNMFIQIPLLVKFYIMYDKDPAYSNFYIGLGGFLHFWPVNFYYIKTNTDLIHSGNTYNPAHSEIPPGNIYTPINIGLKVAIGNHFYVSDRTLLGLEFYLNYLFIPTVNGYYFGQNYNRGNAIILEFSGSIGMIISIGFDMFGDYYSY